MKMDDELTHEIITDDSNTHDLAFKIIIIGDCNVGKSSLTIKAIKNKFEEYYTSTVGFEFYTFNIKIQKTHIKLQIWDTCGQELYRSLISSFYRNTTLAILVYSIENEKSYENVNNWLKELKTQSSPDVKVFLVGNKCDLEDKRVCSKEKAEQFALENQFDFFAESSAKSGFNIQNIFIKAAKILYLEYNKYNNKASTEETEKPKPHIDINDKDQDEHKHKTNCC